MAPPARPLSEHEENELVRLAMQSREQAYCPYSKFPVGAALLVENGDFYTGCNIENASFTPGICAERTACAKAVSEGQTSFLGVAVTATTDHPCSPCGVCRQFLREFCSLELPVFLPPSNWKPTDGTCTMQEYNLNTSKNQRKMVITTLGHLLPMSFGPSDLA